MLPPVRWRLGCIVSRSAASSFNDAWCRTMCPVWFSQRNSPVIGPETRTLLNPDIEASALRSEFSCRFSSLSWAVVQLGRALRCCHEDKLSCDRRLISREFEIMSRIRCFCAAGSPHVISVHDNAPSSAQCLALTLGACCAKHVIHTLLRSVGTFGVQYHRTTNNGPNRIVTPDARLVLSYRPGMEKLLSCRHP